MCRHVSPLPTQVTACDVAAKRQSRAAHAFATSFLVPPESVALVRAVRVTGSAHILSRILVCPFVECEVGQGGRCMWTLVACKGSFPVVENANVARQESLSMCCIATMTGKGRGVNPLVLVEVLKILCFKRAPQFIASEETHRVSCHMFLVAGLCERFSFTSAAVDVAAGQVSH